MNKLKHPAQLSFPVGLDYLFVRKRCHQLCSHSGKDCSEFSV
jgi:hypothetical protein